MLSPSFLLAQAALLALAGAFTVLHQPLLIPPHYQPRHVTGYSQLRMRSGDQNLHCPGAGFFAHPTNCTRFYRCVDYAGTGFLYSKYLFECPKNHVFLTLAQTCLPGSCDGLDQVGHLPPTKPPASPPVGPEDLIPELPEPEVPVTVMGPDEGTAGVTDSPWITEVSTSITPVQECLVNYVQHVDYCNLYYLCSLPSTRYVCPTGTVFDEDKQMCRISAADEGLCTGKEIFQDAFLLRSENFGQHVQIPSSVLVPTSVPIRKQQQTFRQPTVSYSPQQEYIYTVPLGHSTAVRNTGQTFDILKPTVDNRFTGQNFDIFKPAVNNRYTGQNFDIFNPSADRYTAQGFDIFDPEYRPLLSRPAQTYRQPTVSPKATFKSAPAKGPEVDTTLYSLRSSDSDLTQYRPMEHVRRPDGHLHFPEDLFKFYSLKTGESFA